eukprot:jgi/Undpi1/10829/HiC_scaffold_3.g01358.m1
MHRICHACAVAKSSTKDAVTAPAGKRKSTDKEGRGTGPWKSAKSGAGKTDKSTCCARLTLDQKLEILQLLDQGVTHNTIAGRFKCGLRTVSRVQEERKVLEKMAASAASKGGSKTHRSGDFPKARKAKYAVTRAVMFFGRSAKKTLLASVTTTAADKERLERLQASEKWAKNFVVRNGLPSKRLHIAAGSVNPEVVAKGMEEIRKECKNYQLENIYNVDETGIQWKIMPKRTYLSTDETRQTIESKAKSSDKYPEAFDGLMKEPGMTKEKAERLAKLSVSDPILYAIERRREANEINETPMDYDKISGFFPMEWIMTGDFGWGFNKKKARLAQEAEEEAARNGGK